MNYLGRARLASGDLYETKTLLERAIVIAEDTGHAEPAAEGRSWLARALLQLSEPARALAVAASARDVPRPAEQPMLRLLEGLALLELQQFNQAVVTFTDAIVTADALLALSDRSVAALQARALALSGLAAATGDAARADQAAEAFIRADAVTTAAGVMGETTQLLARMVVLDRMGSLASFRAARQL